MNIDWDGQPEVLETLKKQIHIDGDAEDGLLKGSRPCRATLRSHAGGAGVGR
jgi:hypothetical protein